MNIAGRLRRHDRGGSCRSGADHRDPTWDLGNLDIPASYFVKLRAHGPALVPPVILTR
jgi:hypothetical protein